MHKGPLSRDSLVDQRIGCFPFGFPLLGVPSFKEERPPEGGTPNPPIRRSVGQAAPFCLGSRFAISTVLLLGLLLSNSTFADAQTKPANEFGSMGPVPKAQCGPSDRSESGL